jgi:glutamate dehydrogenase/leucine dehydrogenase
MGTNEADMQAIYDVFTARNGGPNHGRGGIGRPPSSGGFPIDEWGITAHGLFAAAKAAERHLSAFRIDGARVIVQGFGNVGQAIARKLAAEGARIVGASDITAGLFRPEGLDLEELSAARLRPEGLSGYREAAPARFSAEALDRLLECPCDLLVPAARPHAIHSGNVAEIRARLVLQGANNPVAPTCEIRLHERGIASLSDFIVNAGGVIAGAVELKADRDPAFDRKVRSDGGSGRHFLEKLVSRVIAANVAETFDRQRKSGMALVWKAAAIQLAKERLVTERFRVLSELEPRA